jgi:hypothetical protein
MRYDRERLHSGGVLVNSGDIHCHAGHEERLRNAYLYLIFVLFDLGVALGAPGACGNAGPRRCTGRQTRVVSLTVAECGEMSLCGFCWSGSVRPLRRDSTSHYSTATQPMPLVILTLAEELRKRKYFFAVPKRPRWRQHPNRPPGAAGRLLHLVHEVATRPEIPCPQHRAIPSRRRPEPVSPSARVARRWRNLGSRQCGGHLNGQTHS